MPPGWSRKRSSAPAAPTRPRSMRWLPACSPERRSPARTPPTPSASPLPTRITWRVPRRALPIDPMIARLTGTLAETSADGAVIDVGGVGYQLLASARTLDPLGPVGGDVTVLTELQVREDAWTLFGFGSAAERDSSRPLTSVQ